MKHIIITILTLLSISLQAQIRMNTKQSFVDSTRLNATGDSLYYYQNGTLINSKGIVASSVSPSFQTLSLGEGYADVAKEYHIADGKTVYPNSLGYNFAELLQADVLSKTSLILTPTAIATGVVASQKPLSSDGDFTFTRSTSATRVNENGYIEKETQNVLTYSNDFSNAAWTNYLITVTGGQTGYDGSSDAWLINKTASARRTEQGNFNPGVYCFSVYVKSNTNNWVELYLDGNFATDPQAYFDLQNGLVGTTSYNIDANIESVGNGWYRCSIVGNMTTNFIAMIFPAEADNDKSATSGSILIQDAQLEQGLVARDYIETTTSAVYGGVTDNVPRIDYTDKTPSLLLEPQRTNFVAQSEYLGSYTPYLATISDNVATSLEGVVNAGSFVEDTSSGRHRIQTNSFAVSSGSTYTFSIFVKNKSGSRLLCINADFLFNARSFFNIVEGVVVETTSGSASIEDYGNGWYRCSVTGTSSVTHSSIVYIGLEDNAVDNGYVGDGTSGHYWYGIQAEAGSYPTSYIPTYGTSVTRNGDAVTKTGISSLIGQTEGSVYIEIPEFFTRPAGTYGAILSLYDGSAANRIGIIESPTQKSLQIYIITDFVTQTIHDFNVDAGVNKIALGYANNDVVIVLNGNVIYTDTSATIPSTSAFALNTYGYATIQAGVSANKSMLFKTRLSNEELAELTKQ